MTLQRILHLPFFFNFTFLHPCSHLLYILCPPCLLNPSLFPFRSHLPSNRPYALPLPSTFSLPFLKFPSQSSLRFCFLPTEGSKIASMGLEHAIETPRRSEEMNSGRKLNARKTQKWNSRILGSKNVGLV